MTAQTVRIHGRGGQGVVTAAEVLALAAFIDGLVPQAFPSFGSERMGAPVTAFCRFATEPIRVREPVFRPDAVIVIDATLLHHVDVFGGLMPDGFVVVNSERTPGALAITSLGFAVPPHHVITVPATEIARKFTGRPVPNIAMLGAFAALTDWISRGALEDAVRMRFGDEVGAANIESLRASFDQVRQPSRA